MLKGYFHNQDDWSVSVLDFDLSWHKGAMEVSVLNPGSVSGFLAPEQVGRREDASTRSAAVDSFGLGMTLYYLRSGIEPVFSQHKHQDWSASVVALMERFGCKTWKSLPRRYARVILCSTRDKQSERWDMSQILGELQRLHDAEKKPTQVESAELLAEEIAARSDFPNNYQWDPDSLKAFTVLASGATVSVRGLEVDRKISVEMRWAETGLEDRRRVRKWIPKACDQASSLLRKAGWKVRIDRASDWLAVEGEIDVKVARSNSTVRL